MGLMNRRALLALVGLMAVAGSAWGWNARDLRNARADADLNGANLQGAHLGGVSCSSATRWPRGFVHPRCQP